MGMRKKGFAAESSNKLKKQQHSGGGGGHVVHVGNHKSSYRQKQKAKQRGAWIPPNERPDAKPPVEKPRVSYGRPIEWVPDPWDKEKHGYTKKGVMAVRSW